MIKDSLGFIAFIAVFLGVLPIVVIIGLFYFVSKLVLRSGKCTKYAFNNLYGVDQFANTILAGHPEETISSRLGRAKIHGYRYKWVRLLRFIVDCLAYPFDGSEHCLKAAKEEGLKMNLDREIWNWNRSNNG